MTDEKKNADKAIGIGHNSTNRSITNESIAKFTKFLEEDVTEKLAEIVNLFDEAFTKRARHPFDQTFKGMKLTGEKLEDHEVHEKRMEAKQLAEKLEKQVDEILGVKHD